MQQDNDKTTESESVATRARPGRRLTATAALVAITATCAAAAFAVVTFAESVAKVHLESELAFADSPSAQRALARDALNRIFLAQQVYLRENKEYRVYTGDPAAAGLFAEAPELERSYKYHLSSTKDGWAAMAYKENFPSVGETDVLRISSTGGIALLTTRDQRQPHLWPTQP